MDIDYVQAATVSHKFNYTFPGCDNNEDKDGDDNNRGGFHLSQKSNCSFPGCDNNEGKGFWDSSTLGNHTQLVYLGEIWNCTFPGCIAKKEVFQDLR